MAFARDSYTASASQTDFTITFSYLDQDDVLVYEDGVLKTVTTDYTLPNATTIRFNSGLVGGEIIVLQRSTSQTTRLVDYTAGALSEAELDTDSLQAFYMAQEAVDIAGLALPIGSDNNWDAESKLIKSLGTPVAATDAVTKAYADALAISSGNVPTPTNPGEDNYALKASGGSFAWGTATAYFWTLAAAASAAAARTVLGAGTLSNVVEDVTPQLGGDLDLNGKNLDFPTTPNISDVIDDDTMATASAVKLATSESIKAYVDSSGALGFVSSTAITAVTSLDVTSLAAGYDYKIVLEGFGPTTDGPRLEMLFSDDNSTYESGAGDYQWGVMRSGTNEVSDNDTEIQLTGVGTVGNDANRPNSMEITLLNPNEGSENTGAIWAGYHFNPDPTPSIRSLIGSAIFKQGVDAVLAIRLQWSGGSTFKAEGNITVWRRKRS